MQIEISEDQLKYLIEYTKKDIFFWKKKQHKEFYDRAVNTHKSLKAEYQKAKGQMNLFNKGEN